MLDASLRPYKDRLLDPLARALGPRLHPNWVSLLGLLAGLGCVLLLARRAYAPALILWLLGRVLDGLDGALARAQRRSSDLGAYLDILFDFAVYSLLPIALVAGRDASPALHLALALLLAAFYVNAASWMYLAAVLEKRGHGARARGESTGVTMPAGLMEGAETIVLFSLFILFPASLLPLFVLTIVLVLATVAQRVGWAARHL